MAKKLLSELKKGEIFALEPINGKTDTTSFYSFLVNDIYLTNKCYYTLATDSNKDFESDPSIVVYTLELHITTHTGKMENIPSISTSCLYNKYCKNRMKNKATICGHCFSETTQKRYSSLAQALERNTLLLTSRVLEDDELPTINNVYFRFESFGDLVNVNQVINYFNICEKNPLTRFALWTKNPWLVQQAIDEGFTKPKNLNIIFSSIFLNEVNNAFVNKYSFIDKVFTVYDKTHAQDVKINCGARDCFTCQKCYKKHKGDVEYINELLK